MSNDITYCTNRKCEIRSQCGRGIEETGGIRWTQFFMPIYDENDHFMHCDNYKELNETTKTVSRTDQQSSSEVTG